MNILQINNYGYVRGGSERYYIDIINLLKEHGDKVLTLYSKSNNDEFQSDYTVKGINVGNPALHDIFKFLYSFESSNVVKKLISSERLDVAHLHIYYGQITSSIISPLNSNNVPIVQTLHEYKLLCPISTMVRNEKICEECCRGSYWRSALYRCNRNSLTRSILSTTESYVSSLLGSKNKIDHFIAVSDFLRNKMIEYGIPKNKITTVHNFVRGDIYEDNYNIGKYFLYFGRVENIKGIQTLVDAMFNVKECDLIIAGEGTALQGLKTKVNTLNAKNIKFAGFKKGDELKKLISDAICVIVPSEWYETFGLVVLESFAQSKPVIASRIGGITELISHGVDGFLVEPGSSEELTEALNWMVANKEKAREMGIEGQKKAKNKFSPEKHYNNIKKVYSKVIANYN